MPARARSALAYVALFAAVGAQAPYFVLYYQSRGFDLAETGRIVSLAALVGLIAAPGWGSLSDRLRGSPAVLLAATATGILGTVLLSQAREPLAVVAAASVVAAGMAGMSPIVDARVLENAGADRSGYGPLRAWGSASYIVSAFATGAAIERWGIQAAFVVLGTSLAVTGAVGLTLRPAAVQRASWSLELIGRVFGRRGLGLFLAAAFLTWAPLAALMGFYSLRFDELGAAATVIGLSSAIGAAVEVPIMLRFPGLVARFGAERLLIVGAALFAARALVAGLAGDPAILVVASGVGGIGYALFLIGGVTYVSLRVPPELAATAQGLFQGVTVSLGQVTAVAVGGAVATITGLGDLYLICAGIGAVATVCVHFAVRAQPVLDRRRSAAT